MKNMLFIDAQAFYMNASICCFHLDQFDKQQKRKKNHY